MRTLRVIDLAESPTGAHRWRQLRLATAVCADGLPAGCVLTPAGFAFTEGSATFEGTPSRLEILPPDELRACLRAGATLSGAGGDERKLPIVALHPDGPRAPASIPSGGLVLEVGLESARVGVDERAWDAVAGPVLLAVAQCWRFREIDRRVDELSNWARSVYAEEERSALRRRRSQIDNRSGDLQRLLLDLSGTEGPLTDPRGFFSTRRAARLYRELARGLGLYRWRTLIDDRIETLESAFAELAEERRHRASQASAIVLEVLILLALLADLAINIFTLLSNG